MFLSHPFLAFAVYSVVCLVQPKFRMFLTTCAAYPENLLLFFCVSTVFVVSGL
jgi:hypothetical protein